jgi:hypothetical protein
MGGAAVPLHDPGNDRAVERRSDRQAARRGRLTIPASPCRKARDHRALTPRPGTRSEAKRLIDAVPRSHPFTLRYTTTVPTLDWGKCEQVINRLDLIEALKRSW